MYGMAAGKGGVRWRRNYQREFRPWPVHQLFQTEVDPLGEVNQQKDRGIHSETCNP